MEEKGNRLDGEGRFGMTDAGEGRDIYVATIIDSHNYGTVMQAVATRDVLSHYGRPLFIDYCRPHWTRTGWVRSYLGRGGNAVANAVKLCANAPARLKCEGMFRGFVERELALVPSAPFLEGGEFDGSAVYCVGSDQTWNVECNHGIDPVYFLTNVPNSCAKIALSASFGRPSLDREERELTRPLLEGFKAISVRESSGVSVLESMGLRGVALKDPVLLCRPELWEGLASGVPRARDGYVLVYMLNDNPRMCAYARRVAGELGLGARGVTFNPLRRAPEGLRGVCLPSPEEWVALFRDAAYVATDSFHGTCFSLLFEKPFTVFNPPKYSVRLADVLSDFGVDGRRAGDDEPAGQISVHGEPVDWDAVRSSKERFRREAACFLDGCLPGEGA